MSTAEREELTQLLTKVRNDRKPTVSGAMMLTTFLSSMMFTHGKMVSDDTLDSLELAFWLTHNGDGTLITEHHDTRGPR